MFDFDLYCDNEYTDQILELQYICINELPLVVSACLCIPVEEYG